jgi:hypothetical protein
VVAELGAELADVDVDGAGVGRERVAPDPFEDLVPGENQAAVADQVAEELELAGGELDRATLEDDLVAGRVDGEVAQVLGCEVGSVKGLVFRARSSLIERRDARETPCGEIREQLETLRGGALRRNELRHHIRHCPGCAAYRDEVGNVYWYQPSWTDGRDDPGRHSGDARRAGVGAGAAGGRTR